MRAVFLRTARSHRRPRGSFLAKPSTSWVFVINYPARGIDGPCCTARTFIPPLPPSQPQHHARSVRPPRACAQAKGAYGVSALRCF